MSDLQFLQVLVGSLFGVSLFVKMWRHSISVFLMLFSSAFALFVYELDHTCAVVVFAVTIIFVTLRGSRKPKGDKVWI